MLFTLMSPLKLFSAFFIAISLGKLKNQHHLFYLSLLQTTKTIFSTTAVLKAIKIKQHILYIAPL